jgi:hypothetical protein
LLRRDARVRSSVPGLKRSDAADGVMAWIPAFAGMTLVSKNASPIPLDPG